MTGSITKRRERVYLLRISLGRDNVTGKRLYYTETVHGTKRDADARLRAKIAELEGGGIVQKTPMTVNELLEKWLATKATEVKRNTHAQYVDLWHRHIEKALGRVPLARLSPLVVQEYYNGLVERKVGVTAIRHVHVLLHSAFKIAVKWRLLSFNPAADTVRPSTKKPKVMRAMTLEQGVAFVRASYSHWYGYLLRFLLTSGARPEEAFALQWSDIDFRTGIVNIDKALLLDRKKGGWYFDTPKSASSLRKLTLDRRDLDDLLEWRTKQLQMRQFAGDNWLAGHDFVFTSKRGTPMRLTSIKKHFADRCYREAGASGKRIYDLRHTMATLLLLAREPAKIVSERLGHGSIGITLNTYSHVLPSMDRDASRRITDLLRPEE